MNETLLSIFAGIGTSLARGTLLELAEDGTLLVGIADDPPRRILCDYLQTTGGPGPRLRPGDVVVLALPRSLDEKGCVLGRVGAYRAPEPPPVVDKQRVVIEADKDLVLQCGESSMTLTNQGQILIKGADVVTRAKRNLRIRGGSVQIN